MDFGDQFVRIGGDDGKRPNPFARSRLLPVLPNASDAEWRAILHSDRVGLLCLLTLDRLPLKEPVHRHNAAAQAVGVAERGQVPHRLAFGVNWLSAAVPIIAPIRDETPPERV